MVKTIKNILKLSLDKLGYEVRNKSQFESSDDPFIILSKVLDPIELQKSILNKLA